jgi:hypothetical protein
MEGSYDPDNLFRRNQNLRPRETLIWLTTKAQRFVCDIAG